MITLDTQFPIAYESDDHRFPWGTRTSNANNGYFRAKLLRLFDENINWALLDLGCSGGAFVESLHEMGVAAVGIEGSDYSWKNKRGSWSKLGGHRLFTSDITKPFSLRLHDVPMMFDVITAWDVLEHLHRGDFATTFENVHRHLKNEGICIFSVATVSDCVNGVELHKTIMSRNHWEGIFIEYGFEPVVGLKHYLAGHSARGRRLDESTGFNIVLKKKGTSPRATAPIVGNFEKIADRFIGSKVQKKLKSLITGEQL